MLNCVHNYKATSDFSDDEVGKISHLWVDMVYIGTLSPLTHVDDACTAWKNVETLLYDVAKPWNIRLHIRCRPWIENIYKLRVTIRITNRCNFLYYVFISFFSSFPYMFRAFMSPSSGVFQAVVFMLPFGSGSALLIVCLRQRTGLWWWLRCTPKSPPQTSLLTHADDQQSTAWTKW